MNATAQARHPSDVSRRVAAIAFDGQVGGQARLPEARLVLLVEILEHVLDLLVLRAPRLVLTLEHGIDHAGSKLTALPEDVVGKLAGTEALLISLSPAIEAELAHGVTLLACGLDGLEPESSGALEGAESIAEALLAELPSHACGLHVLILHLVLQVLELLELAEGHVLSRLASQPCVLLVGKGGLELSLLILAATLQAGLLIGEHGL